MQIAKKALHQMANRGQLSRFVQQGKGTNQSRQEASQKKQRDAD